MPISNACVWEVRSTGNNANGGGFVTGASGTDFSQQDTAQFALTGIATVGAGATFLTASAAASMVGNIANVVSGTNFTVGRYQIISVVVGVSVTVDRSITTGVGAAGVINIGGAFATIQPALTNLTVEGQICYVKSATYTITTGLTFAVGGGFSRVSRMIGYGTTRGDKQRPTIETSSAITMLTTQGGWSVENFAFDGNVTATLGIDNANFTSVINCTVADINGVGITGQGIISFTSVSGCTTGITQIGPMHLLGCVTSGNSGNGIMFNLGSSCTVTRCVSMSNGGSGLEMVFNTVVSNSLFYGNANHGINNSSLSAYNTYVVNCIFANNTLFGYRAASANNSIDLDITYNAFWANGSGPVSNYTLDSVSVSIAGTYPTNDPFVDSTNGDFALNNVAGAGALLRAAGFPGAMGNSIGYTDIGAFQHQDSGGTSGIIRNPEL